MGKLTLVDVGGATAAVSWRIVVYTRVSSHDQRADFDRQVARLSALATGQAMSVDQVVCEVGSRMTGKRRKLPRLLADRTASVVGGGGGAPGPAWVSSTWGRLVGPGSQDRAVDEGEANDDLMRDMTEVLTSFVPGRTGVVVPGTGPSKPWVAPRTMSVFVRNVTPSVQTDF